MVLIISRIFVSQGFLICSSLQKERKLPLASEDATEDNRKIKIHRLNSIEIPEIFFIKLSRVIVKSFFLVYLSIFSDEWKTYM